MSLKRWTAALLLVPYLAHAADGARVLSVDGVVIARAAAAAPRVLGADAELAAGDVVHVSAASHALLELADRMRLTLRPGTVFRVGDYRPGMPISALEGLLKGGIRSAAFDARLCERDCGQEERDEPNLDARAVARAVEIEGEAAASDAGGAARRLAVGSTVYEGEGIATGPRSYVVLAFRDGARLTLSSNSLLAIKAFDYDERGQSGRAYLKLLTGRAQVATGRLAKISPHAFLFESAVGVVRPHGTGFNASGCVGDLCGSVSVNADDDGVNVTASASDGNNSVTVTTETDVDGPKTEIESTTTTETPAPPPPPVEEAKAATQHATDKAKQGADIAGGAVVGAVTGAAGGFAGGMGQGGGDAAQDARDRTGNNIIAVTGAALIGMAAGGAAGTVTGAAEGAKAGAKSGSEGGSPSDAANAGFNSGVSRGEQAGDAAARGAIQGTNIVGGAVVGTVTGAAGGYAGGMGQGGGDAAQDARQRTGNNAIAVTGAALIGMVGGGVAGTVTGAVEGGKAGAESGEKGGSAGDAANAGFNSGVSRGEQAGDAAARGAIQGTNIVGGAVVGTVTGAAGGFATGMNRGGGTTAKDAEQRTGNNIIAVTGAALIGMAGGGIAGTVAGAAEGAKAGAESGEKGGSADDAANAGFNSGLSRGARVGTDTGKGAARATNSIRDATDAAIRDLADRAADRAQDAKDAATPPDPTDPLRLLLSGPQMERAMKDIGIAVAAANLASQPSSKRLSHEELQAVAQAAAERLFGKGEAAAHLSALILGLLVGQAVYEAEHAVAVSIIAALIIAQLVLNIVVSAELLLPAIVEVLRVAGFSEASASLASYEEALSSATPLVVAVVMITAAIVTQVVLVGGAIAVAGASLGVACVMILAAIAITTADVASGRHVARETRQLLDRFGAGKEGSRDASSSGESAPALMVWDGSVEVTSGTVRTRVSKGQVLRMVGGRPVVLADTGSFTARGPRPDLVNVDAAFAAPDRPIDPGLYVWAREGRLWIVKEGRFIDTPPGNVAMATRTGATLVEAVPGFMRFDRAPRPDRASADRLPAIFVGRDGSVFGSCRVN